MDAPAVGFEEQVALLCRPEAWPGPPARVELVEAHLSLVFLVGDHAYKLKKPVRFGDLDLRSIEARRRHAETEVRLNRRLAPDVYLGVVPVVPGPEGTLAVGGDGTPVDWMVRMRRLPADAFLDQRIRSHRTDPARLGQAARRLARFWLAQPPAIREPEAYARLLERQLDELSDRLAATPDPRGAELVDVLRGWMQDHRGGLAARVADGRVVEGHGDLRPEHVCMIDPPVIIDCLEFDPRLRTLDCVDDLGFLAMECERLGAPEVGMLFVDVWRREARDEFHPGLMAFYQALRALSRASVAAMRLAGGAVPSIRSTVLPERLRRRRDAYVALAEVRLPALRGEAA